MIEIIGKVIAHTSWEKKMPDGKMVTEHKISITDGRKVLDITGLFSDGCPYPVDMQKDQRIPVYLQTFFTKEGKQVTNFKFSKPSKNNLFSNIHQDQDLPPLDDYTSSVPPKKKGFGV